MRLVALAAVVALRSLLGCSSFAGLADTAPAAGGSRGGAGLPPNDGAGDPEPAPVSMATSVAEASPTSVPLRPSPTQTEAGAGGQPEPALGTTPDAGIEDSSDLPLRDASVEPPATEPMPAPPPPKDPPGTVRYVRLVADSEVGDRPVTSIAEFNLIGQGGAPLDRSLWVASADSSEPTLVGGAPAQQAIDGDLGSLWHTAWFELAEPPSHPHYLQVALGRPERVAAFRYLPRQDSPAGRISEYRFFLSRDGENWGEPVVSGVFPDTADEQTVVFEFE